ncbi:RDD family protein [Candidatus Bathyarchaeota archaeon]|nr:RDD family protein [Candidatus Bathyarchaeota archaeon]
MLGGFGFQELLFVLVFWLFPLIIWFLFVYLPRRHKRQNYAGFWTRGAAITVDTIPFATLYIFIGSVLEIEESEIGTVIFWMYFLILYWLYFALMESSSRQATLGKRVFGIIVTDLEGKKISFGKATGRHFAKWLSGLIFYIGFIMAGFTKKKQALHDIMTGCLVVMKEQRTDADAVVQTMSS